MASHMEISAPIEPGEVAPRPGALDRSPGRHILISSHVTDATSEFDRHINGILCFFHLDLIICQPWLIFDNHGCDVTERKILSRRVNVISYMDFHHEAELPLF